MRHQFDLKKLDQWTLCEKKDLLMHALNPASPLHKTIVALYEKWAVVLPGNLRLQGAQRTTRPTGLAGD